MTDQCPDCKTPMTPTKDGGAFCPQCGHVAVHTPHPGPCPGEACQGPPSRGQVMSDVLEALKRIENGTAATLEDCRREARGALERWESAARLSGPPGHHLDLLALTERPSFVQDRERRAHAKALRFAWEALTDAQPLGSPVPTRVQVVSKVQEIMGASIWEEGGYHLAALAPLLDDWVARGLVRDD